MQLTGIMTGTTEGMEIGEAPVRVLLAETR